MSSGYEMFPLIGPCGDRIHCFDFLVTAVGPVGLPGSDAGLSYCSSLPVLSCQQSLLFMEETESDWALSADPRNTGSGRGGCLAVDQLYGRFRLKQKGAFLWLEICLDVAAVYVLIKY